MIRILPFLAISAVTSAIASLGGMVIGGSLIGAGVIVGGLVSAATGPVDASHVPAPVPTLAPCLAPPAPVPLALPRLPYLVRDTADRVVTTDGRYTIALDPEGNPIAIGVKQSGDVEWWTTTMDYEIAQQRRHDRPLLPSRVLPADE